MKLLLEALNKTRISENNWPDFYSFNENIEKFSNQILKLKAKWLTLSDIYIIFASTIYNFLSKKFPLPKNNIALEALLDNSELQTVQNEIFQYIESIPRDYEIYLPLPSIKAENLDSFEIASGIDLKIFTDTKDIPKDCYKLGGLASFTSIIEPNKPYLRFKISGFSGGRLENYCIAEALYYSKIILFAGLHDKIFVSNVMDQPSNYIFPNGNHQIPKINLISIDLKNPEVKPIITTLPLNTGKFITHLAVNILENKVKEAMHNKQTLVELFKAILKKPAEICKENTQSAKRIKMAAQWCFDSQAEENTTISFIQNCIGLECILGEDIDSSPVTSTLADRCAYMLGKNSKARAYARKQTRDLYTIRSNLLHGKDSKNTDISRIHIWGQLALQDIINREILNFKLDDEPEIF